ncbi:MAG: hypothetical protein PF503_05955 [Desulfobacula sp.]|jgi:hypothetical protein|nr:hypothetical protein [Desulfobacula sp.]
MEILNPLQKNGYNTQTFQSSNLSQELSIELNSCGANEYTKVSFPVKYGLFSKFETDDYIFEFNLNHEIRHARSKKRHGFIHQNGLNEPWGMTGFIIPRAVIQGFLRL